MKKLVLFLTFLTSGFNYDVCNEKYIIQEVDRLNSQARLYTKDGFYIGKAACNDNIFYEYIVLVDLYDIKFSEFNKVKRDIFLKDIKEYLVNVSCYEPEAKMLLNLVDKIVLKYYLENGSFFFFFLEKSNLKKVIATKETI